MIHIISKSTFNWEVTKVFNKSLSNMILSLFRQDSMHPLQFLLTKSTHFALEEDQSRNMKHREE